MAVRFSKAFRWGSQRVSLWLLLLALVVALLGILVWLAGRYESSLVQSRLEQQALEAVTDIRSGLNRNTQAFQALHARERGAEAWLMPAGQLLHQNREMLRLEWRNPALDVVSFVETSYRTSVFEQVGRPSLQADVGLTCTAARRISGAAYSASYFLPQSDGLGTEVVDMCLPIVVAGRVLGYTVTTY